MPGPGEESPSEYAARMRAKREEILARGVEVAPDEDELRKIELEERG